jgi:hypothetical protein
MNPRIVRDIIMNSTNEMQRSSNSSMTPAGGDIGEYYQLV